MSDIKLEIITAQSKEAFRSLFNLYHHDLVNMRRTLFPTVDEKGYYDYNAIEEYFADENKDKVHLYLIRHQNHPAGFIVVTIPPFVKQGCDYCIHEFFITGNVRGTGIAGRACEALFSLHPGRYSLLVIQENVVAKAFWKKIVDKFSSDIKSSENNDGDTTYMFSV